MPLLRTAIGTLLLLLAVPLVLAGAALGVVYAHRGPDGAYSASIERLHVDGRAVIVSDVDALLRRDAPFARGGQTRLMISAVDPGGPLVVGLARRADAEAYLAGVGYTKITRVGLTRGALPVQTVGVPGDAPPSVAPTAASLWVARATGLYRDHRAEDPLTWSPSAWRNAGLTLVVMRADGSAGMDLTLRAALAPAWLKPTTWGLSTLGGCLLLLGLAALWWPHRRRQVMYVVEPDRVPEVAARLGVAVPADRPLTLGSLTGGGDACGDVAGTPGRGSVAGQPVDEPDPVVPAAPVLSPPPVRLRLALPRLSVETSDDTADGRGAVDAAGAAGAIGGVTGTAGGAAVGIAAVGIAAPQPPAPEVPVVEVPVVEAPVVEVPPDMFPSADMAAAAHETSGAGAGAVVEAGTGSNATAVPDPSTEAATARPESDAGATSDGSAPSDAASVVQAAESVNA